LLNFGLIGRRRSDPLAALIAQLFGNAEQGAFYIPRPVVNGTQSLFQDAAGTTPVTADGDPVGLMIDKSGNGNHASQSISGSRPIYRTNGTLHWLQADGVDDLLDIPSAVFGLNSSSNSIVSASECIRGFYLIGANGDNGIQQLSHQTGFRSGIRLASGSQLIGASSGLYATGTTAIASTIYNAAGSFEHRINRQYADSVSFTSVDKDTPSTYALFSRGSQYHSRLEGKIYGIIIKDSIISEQQRVASEDYFADLAGVTL